MSLCSGKHSNIKCFEDLEEVIGHIYSNGLKLEPKKYSLFQKSIVYPSTTGMRANPEMLQQLGTGAPRRAIKMLGL